MSGRGRARPARVRVARLLGRPEGARLTVDHLTFDLSEAEVEALARQLLGVLAARPAARPHARRMRLDVVGETGGKVTIERREP